MFERFKRFRWEDEWPHAELVGYPPEPESLIVRLAKLLRSVGRSAWQGADSQSQPQEVQPIKSAAEAEAIADSGI